MEHKGRLIWLQGSGKNAIRYLPQQKHCEWQEGLQNQKIHLIQEQKNRMAELTPEITEESNYLPL